MLGIVLAIQAGAGGLLLWGSVPVRSPRKRWAILAGMGISGLVLVLGFLLRFGRVNWYFTPWWAGWGRGLIITWGFVSILLAAAVIISRWWLRVRPEYSAARRGFLHTTR